MIHVRAPATTANLGPGFDCAAVALDLWNELEVGDGDCDEPEHLGVNVYDPNKNEWLGDPLPIPDELGLNRQAKNGFYDPALNAVFLHSAGDSDDNGTIWVYRYKVNKK